MDVVLNSSYFPTINYFRCLHLFSNSHIDLFEQHQRHSSRNRTTILGANGTILLTVPIKKKSKTIMKDVKIANQEWQKKHIMSIKSAYGSAPFFIHYFEEIKQLINSKQTYLVDLNNIITKYFIKQLEIKKTINHTNIYQKLYPLNYMDFRDKININKHEKIYHQVFGENFLPNLSIIDLIFNLGPEAKNYITS